MKTPCRTHSAILSAIAGAVALVILSAPAQSQSLTQAPTDQGQMSKRQWPSQSYKQPPVTARICSCLYAGQNIPIGQTVCMKFRGVNVLARCDTVVNSPSWSITKKPCPPV